MEGWLITIAVTGCLWALLVIFNHNYKGKGKE